MQKLILILFLLPTLSLAKDWEKVVCSNDLKTLAKEAIRLSYSGKYLTEKSLCLKEKKFNYFSAEHEPPMDSIKKPKSYLNRSAKIDIANIKDTGLGSFIVSFSVNNDGEKFSDQLTVIIYRDSKEKKDIECANISNSVKVPRLYKDCK